jgi:thymidine phosphorylase
MLVAGRLAASPAEGWEKAETCLGDGRAAASFARMVRALGGPADLLEHADRHLPRAPVVRPCPTLRAGMVAGMNARDVGLAVVTLGGGRRHAGDRINPAVGLSDVASVGQAILPGEPLAMVHAADDAAADAAIEALQQAISIEDTAPMPRPVIRARLDGDGADPHTQERAA